MSFVRALVTRLIRFVISLLCRVDASELAKLPRRGPFVVATNHVNFLEVPLLYSWLWPRRLIGLVKRETWDQPVLGFLARLWEAIPVRRAGGDPEALAACSAVLARGGFLAIAPEGTRSGNGRLLKGRPGVVTIAIQSGAPIVPLVHSGGERFWANLRRLRRTRIVLRVGEPFRIGLEMKDLTHRTRQEVADEIMRRMAVLLPPWQWGAYADPAPSAVPSRHLLSVEWPDVPAPRRRA